MKENTKTNSGAATEPKPDPKPATEEEKKALTEMSDIIDKFATSREMSYSDARRQQLPILRAHVKKEVVKRGQELVFAYKNVISNMKADAREHEQQAVEKALKDAPLPPCSKCGSEQTHAILCEGCADEHDEKVVEKAMGEIKEGCRQELLKRHPCEKCLGGISGLKLAMQIIDARWPGAKKKE